MCGKILGDSSEKRSHTDENHTKSEVSVNSEENIGDESVKVCGECGVGFGCNSKFEEKNTLATVAWFYLRKPVLMLTGDQMRWYFIAKVVF